MVRSQVEALGGVVNGWARNQKRHRGEWVSLHPDPCLGQPAA
jgi:hypothetical protein